MATKHYCDGCDRELQPGMLRRIKVSIQETGDVKQAGGDWELCTSCVDNLISQVDPTHWTRHLPPAMKRAM